MSKHPYDVQCQCARCVRERNRRAAQSRRAPRTIPEVMTDWGSSRNRRRARAAAEWWDAYESGRPMSSDDY